MMSIPRYRRKGLKQLLAGRFLALALCWLLGMSSLAISCAPTPPKKPNILLITLDTTRRDHLSCYGYPQKITPNIDRLAEEGIRYEHAMSPSSWTFPAHVSLFTGMLPTHHNAHFGSDESVTGLSLSFYTLHPMLPTLPEELSKAGYYTHGIIAGPTISKKFGISRGFDHYDDRLPESKVIAKRHGDEVSSLAIRCLEDYRLSQNEKPFFLFLNYFDPHNPYRAPEPWGDGEIAENIYNVRSGHYDEVYSGTHDLTDKERDILLRQYRDEIKFMDNEIGRLFDEMKRLEIYDSTMIVVTADHGESFGEHRLMEHGRALYEELIRVPLIIKYPSRDKRQGTVKRRVSTISIMPTLLKYIGHPVPGAVKSGTLDDDNQMLIAEVFRDNVWTETFGSRYDMDQKAVYEGDFKWIWRSKGDPELYNVIKDPGEKNNLFGKSRDLEQRFQSQLLPLIEESKEFSSLSTPELDQELRRRLKALGYIQ